MRTLAWISQGAASMVAALMTPEAMLVRCETGNEDEDNQRFEDDCAAWLKRPITVLRSEEYADCIDVWERERYMAGIHGASCTRAMKVEPRLAFQRPDDRHVFGYTADARDVIRYRALERNYPELRMSAPLLDAGITKQGALALIERAGIKLPRTYAMGFPNANCLKTGCVKASSPDYWALFRREFPERFAAQAERSRRIGAKLLEIRDQRLYLDELPDGWPVRKPIAPVCDFLCILAEKEIA